MAVRRDLDAIAEPRGEVIDEGDCRLARPIADPPGRNKLAVGVDRNPCPNVAGIFRSSLRPRDVLLFRVNEAPDALSPEERAESARKAALARWSKPESESVLDDPPGEEEEELLEPEP